MEVCFCLFEIWAHHCLFQPLHMYITVLLVSIRICTIVIQMQSNKLIEIIKEIMYIFISFYFFLIVTGTWFRFQFKIQWYNLHCMCFVGFFFSFWQLDEHTCTYDWKLGQIFHEKTVQEYEKKIYMYKLQVVNLETEAS